MVVRTQIGRIESLCQETMRFRKKPAVLIGASVLVFVCFLYSRPLLLADPYLGVLFSGVHPPVTNVLIVTYMRSGSSLLGDILQQGQGAFYVFEPLRVLRAKIDAALLRENAAFTVFHVNGSQSVISNYEDYYAMDTNLLYNWFSCDIFRLPWVGLSDAFLERGNKTRQFTSCMATANYEATDETKCIQQLRDACMTSPIRVIKTIRLTLQSAKILLAMLPNLKIVHLVRDPRATLHSQENVAECTEDKDGINGCTSRHCSRLNSDIIQEEVIAEQYPNRILTTFYEDIAYHPIETSRRIFEFVGTTFTAAAEQYVFDITMAGRNESCTYCTTRANSSAHVNDWKVEMSRNFITLAQTQCKNAFDKYNYSLLSHVELQQSAP